MKNALLNVALMFSISLCAQQMPPAQQKSQDQQESQVQKDQRLKQFVQEQARIQCSALNRYRNDAIKEAPMRKKDSQPSIYIEQRAEQRALLMLSRILEKQESDFLQLEGAESIKKLAQYYFERAKTEKLEQERIEREKKVAEENAAQSKGKRFERIYVRVLCMRYMKKFNAKKRSCLFCWGE